MSNLANADASSAPTAEATLDPYERKLFLFLGVAAFFEGYDFIALSQILPSLREDFGLDPAWSGYLVGVVNVGTVLAYFFVRLADRWGRRRLLTVTIAGYTLFTTLSGLAPDVFWFVVLQLLARVFLIAEWATSLVIAAEEFPANRRGVVIGILQGINGLGAIVCASLVPFLVETPVLGWRAVYLVAVLPLLALAAARRGLRETRRFEAQTARATPRSLWHLWSTPYRKRALQLGMIWFVSYIAAQNAVSLWKEHAIHGLGFTEAEAGLAIAIAAGLSLPLVFGVGKLLDHLGRRPAAAIVYVVGALGTYLCFTVEGFPAVTAALVLGIFGAQAYIPVLSSYNGELFPTDLRSDAFAWCNNLIGRIAYVGAPFAVGGIVATTNLGYGPVVATLGLFPLIAAGMIYAFLPETRNRELEETSALAE